MSVDRLTDAGIPFSPVMKWTGGVGYRATMSDTEGVFRENQIYTLNELIKKTLEMEAVCTQPEFAFSTATFSDCRGRIAILKEAGRALQKEYNCFPATQKILTWIGKQPSLGGYDRDRALEEKATCLRVAEAAKWKAQAATWEAYISENIQKWHKKLMPTNFGGFQVDTYKDEDKVTYLLSTSLSKENQLIISIKLIKDIVSSENYTTLGVLTIYAANLEGKPTLSFRWGDVASTLEEIVSDPTREPLLSAFKDLIMHWDALQKMPFSGET